MRRRIFSSIIKCSSNPRRIGKRKPAQIMSRLNSLLKTQTKESIAPEK